MKKIRKRKRKIPWIKGFLKPSFTFAPPELRLSDESVRRNIYLVLSIILLICFLGFIYLWTQNPPAYVAGPGGVPTLLVHGIYASSIAESIAVGFLFGLGLLGLYLVRSSVRTQEHVERRDLTMWLGFFFIFLSILSLYLIFAVKTGRTFRIG